MTRQQSRTLEELHQSRYSGSARLGQRTTIGGSTTGEAQLPCLPQGPCDAMLRWGKTVMQTDNGWRQLKPRSASQRHHGLVSLLVCCLLPEKGREEELCGVMLKPLLAVMVFVLGIGRAASAEVRPIAWLAVAVTPVVAAGAWRLRVAQLQRRGVVREVRHLGQQLARIAYAEALGEPNKHDLD